MLELSSTKENLYDLLRYCVSLYDNRRFPGFKAVYQFVFKDEGAEYFFYISVSGGKAQLSEGKHDSPSITIYAPVCVWYDVASGRLNGLWGLLTGKYRIEGPLYYLKVFTKVFGKTLKEEDIPGVEDAVQDFEILAKRKWQKPNNVLIINGSPRCKEGFTYFYLRHLIGGIESAGAKVEIIDIYNEDFTFSPCEGHFTCWTETKGKCHIHDKACELLEKVGDSYLTIYAFPLYINSIPAKLKAFLDRTFIHIAPVFAPYYNLTRHPLWDQKERYSAVFAVSGFPEIEYFKPTVENFKNTGISFHQPLIAAILRPGGEFFFAAPPYRERLKEILGALEQAGRELVEQGKVSQKTLNASASNLGISKKLWRVYSNLYWTFREADARVR
jgi:putative NADPH-quinone reductase/putative sterol carrier protein